MSFLVGIIFNVTKIAVTAQLGRKEVGEILIVYMLYIVLLCNKCSNIDEWSSYF